MLATPGAVGLKIEPWYDAGRKPLLKQSIPPGGIRPPLSTTNPGKSWHSLPSPYVTQAPWLGRPWSPLPVWRK